MDALTDCSFLADGSAAAQWLFVSIRQSWAETGSPPRSAVLRDAGKHAAMREHLFNHLVFSLPHQKIWTGRPSHRSHSRLTEHFSARSGSEACLTVDTS